MRKITLLIASCGLVSLPVASLVACGSVWGDEQDSKLEKDEEGKEKVKLESFYYTTLADRDTFGFETGQTYSPSQLGIDNSFNDQYSFEIESYDDLQGTLNVNVMLTKNQVLHKLKTAVEIRGFKSLNFVNFLAKVTEKIPEDKVLTSDLLTKVKPSQLKDMALLNVETLGIAHYFKLRQSKHFIKVVSHDDLTGDLVIDVKIAIANQDQIIRLTVTDLEVGDLVLRERLDKIRQAMEKLDASSTTKYSNQLPSALVQRKGDQDFWDQLGIGQFPDLEDEHIEVDFEIGSKTSDAKGQLELIVTFKTTNQANSLKRSKTVLISGFLTSDQAKQNRDHVKAQVVKDWFEQLDKKTSLNTLLPTQAKRMFLSNQSQQNLAGLGLDEMPPDLKKGVKIELIPGVPSDEHGTLSLLVKIEVGQVRAEISITIVGYLTTEQVREQIRQKNRQDLVDLLAYIEKNRQQTRFNKKLPTQVAKVKESVDFPRIGLDHLEQNVLQDARVKLLVRSTNDDTGEIKLEVIVSKGGESDSRLIVVRGFQTNAEVIRERQRQILQQLHDFLDWASANWLVSKHKNLKPTQIGTSQSTVTQSELGLEKTPGQTWEGVATKFIIIKPDDFTGEIEVELTVTKLGETARKTLLIGGYKTHQKTIDELLTWLTEHRNKTSFDQKLPSQIYHQKDRPSFTNLGLDELPTELFGDYSVEIELTGFNDDDGLLKLKVSISKGELVRSIPYLISGYKTSNEIRDQLRKMLNRFQQERALTIHRDKLPSSIGSKGQSISLEELGLSDLYFLDQHQVSWELTFAVPNDLAGQVEILVKLTCQGVTFSGYVVVRGFFTTSDELKKLLERIQSEELVTSHREKLPSSVGVRGQAVTWQDVGLGKYANLEKEYGAWIKLTIIAVDNQNGMLWVKADLYKSSVSEEGMLTVVGFRKIDQHIQEITRWKDKLTNWLQTNWSKTSLKHSLPSQVAQPGQEKSFVELGLPPVPADLENIFKLIIKVQRVNDLAGEISLDIKLEHPTRHFDLGLIVRGFKTTEQVRNELRVSFDWIVQHRNLTSQDRALPSDLYIPGQKITFEELGLSALPAEVSQTISVELVVEEALDASGQVKVRVLLSKNGVPLTNSYLVGGFKKLSQYFAELTTLIRQKLSKVNFPNTLPSQIAGTGAVIDFYELGIPAFEQSKWPNTEVQMVVDRVNDQKGELTIEIKISRLEQTHKVSVTLRGFLNKLTFDQRAVDQVVRQIKDLHATDHDSSKIVLQIDKSSHLYEIKISDVNLDMIENDLRAWGIILPTNLETFSLEWKIVSRQENLNTLVLSLQIARAQAKSEIIFNITGFKPYSDKLVDAIWESVPDQTQTKLSQTLVSEFPFQKAFPFADLGVAIFGLENELLEFKAQVIDRNDNLGQIVTLVKIASLATGYARSKNLVVTGYWNDAKRAVARQDIPKEIDRIFGRSYFDAKLADLSELDLTQIVTYDSTSLSNKWIGDDERYAVGRMVRMEDLKLLTTTRVLTAMLEKLGPSKVARLTFEVAERPSGARFGGLISIWPILRYVDLEFKSNQPVVVDGFQSFENYVQRHVRNLKTKFDHQIEQGYHGLLASLFQEWLANSGPGHDGQISKYPRQYDQSVPHASVNKFLELTQLADLLTYRIDGKYELLVVDILGEPLGDDQRIYDLGAYDFEFLFGIKGQEAFNQKVYQSEFLYDKLYRGKRSFAKKLTGFATRADVVKTVTRVYAELDNSLTLKAPNWHLSHFRGILQFWYGEESLPEFPHDFGYSPKYHSKRERLSKLFKPLKPDDFNGKATVNYSQADDVDRWLDAIEMDKRYHHWKMMPADWSKVFALANADPKNQVERRLFYSAQPYFRFMSVDDLKAKQPTMYFKVAFGWRAYDGKATSYDDQTFEETIEVEKLAKQSLVIRLKMQRSLVTYLEQLMSQSGLESALFDPTVQGKLGARLVNSDSKRHKMEVKIAYDGENYDDYYSRLDVEKFYWEEQINYSPGTFVWWFLERPEEYPGALDGHLIHDVFASWRLTHQQIRERPQRHLPRHEISFEKLLANLGVTILLDKIEATKFDKRIQPNKLSPKINASVRFQPWLLYNNHIYVQQPCPNYKPVTYKNWGTESLLIKTNWFWEIDYQIYYQKVFRR